MEEEEGPSTHEDVRYLDEEYVTHELKGSNCDTGGITKNCRLMEEKTFTSN